MRLRSFDLGARFRAAASSCQNCSSFSGTTPPESWSVSTTLVIKSCLLSDIGMVTGTSECSGYLQLQALRYRTEWNQFFTLRDPPVQVGHTRPDETTRAFRPERDLSQPFGIRHGATDSTTLT